MGLVFGVAPFFELLFLCLSHFIFQHRHFVFFSFHFICASLFFSLCVYIPLFAIAPSGVPILTLFGIAFVFVFCSRFFCSLPDPLSFNPIDSLGPVPSLVAHSVPRVYHDRGDC